MLVSGVCAWPCICMYTCIANTHMYTYSHFFDQNLTLDYNKWPLCMLTSQQTLVHLQLLLWPATDTCFQQWLQQKRCPHRRRGRQSTRLGHCNVCVCMYLCMYVCMHVRIHVYIYIYTCFVCTYVYMYVCTCVCRSTVGTAGEGDKVPPLGTAMCLCMYVCTFV